MKNSKKILSVFLSLVMVMSTFVVAMVPASAANYNGENRSCSGCGHALVIHYHAPTCLTSGYYEYVCTYIACKTPDNHFTFLEAKGHGYNKGTKTVLVAPATCTTTAIEHTICLDCGTVIGKIGGVAQNAHEAGAKVITTPATIDSLGEMTVFCKKCGVPMSTEKFSYTAHTHEKAYSAIVREPSCVSDGLEGTVCKICNAVYETSPVSATGHSEPQFVLVIAPTCTTAGENSGYCTYCGDIIATEPVSALGHTEGITTVSIVPTCKNEGEKVTTCDRCGNVIATEVLEKTKHDNGYWVVEYEATIEHEGRKNLYCSLCNVLLKTEEFELHTHTPGYTQTTIVPTCVSEGEKSTFCAKCGACYMTEVLPETNHHWTVFYMNSNGTHSQSCTNCGYVFTENCKYDVLNKVEPTCTTDGYTTYICNTCNYTFVDDVVPALGHDWTGWVEDGNHHTKTCKRCGVQVSEAHQWGDWIFNNDNTLCKDGTMTRYCDLCTASQTQSAPNTSQIKLFFAKIKAFFVNLFTLNVRVIGGGNDEGTNIVFPDHDSDSDSDSGFDSNSDSASGWKS